MNNKANFWFWFGLILIGMVFFVFYINLDNFGKIPPDTNFLQAIFIFAIIMGVIITLVAYLKKNPF